MSKQLADNAAALLGRKRWTDLNEFVRELIQLLVDGATSTTTSTTTTSTTTTLSSSAFHKRFIIVAAVPSNDYLTCTDSEGETVYVAKPYKLRPSTWQGQSYTISHPEWQVDDRVCEMYVTWTTMMGDEPNRITRTRTRRYSDNNVLEVQFTEAILPYYVPGDEIIGVEILAGTGVTGGDGVETLWLDANVDGRSWRPDGSLTVS